MMLVDRARIKSVSALSRQKSTSAMACNGNEIADQLRQGGRSVHASTRSGSGGQFYNTLDG